MDEVLQTELRDQTNMDKTQGCNVTVSAVVYPMKEMISKVPSVVNLVLDKCLKPDSRLPPDHKNYTGNLITCYHPITLYRHFLILQILELTIYVHDLLNIRPSTRHLRGNIKSVDLRML